jgi:hypothetical protein
MEQNNNQFNSALQMNPINPAPVIPSPILAQPQEKKSGIWPVIIAIAITAVIVGGAMYWWMISREAELNSEISGLQNQVGQLNIQLSAQTDIAEQLSDNIVEAEFKLEALSSLGINDVLRDSRDKDKFYYIKPVGGYVFEIMIYDLAKDSDYRRTGDFNIAMGSSLLLREETGKLQELRSVGILDNKFIFTKVANDYSLDICSSKWLYPELEYIDLNASSTTRQAYVLPEDLKDSETQKEQQCQNALNS